MHAFLLLLLTAFGFTAPNQGASVSMTPRFNSRESVAAGLLEAARPANLPADVVEESEDGEDSFAIGEPATGFVTATGTVSLETAYRGRSEELCGSCTVRGPPATRRIHS